jgi:hypothetical protein
MAPLSFYFNTGIGIILVLVSMACFVFTIKSDADYQPGPAVSSFLTGKHVANRNSAREVTVIVATKKSDIGVQAPNYFAQYHMEVQAAIEGTFLIAYGNESTVTSDFRPVTEIVVNSDNSYHFLNGLVFIDDTVQSTTHVSRNSSSTISDPNLLKHDRSTFDAAFRPLSNLYLEDIPEGLPTISASDLKISVEDTGTSEMDNKGNIMCVRVTVGVVLDKIRIVRRFVKCC